MTRTEFLSDPAKYWNSCPNGGWMYEVLAQRMGVVYYVTDFTLRKALTKCQLEFIRLASYGDTETTFLKIYAAILRVYFPTLASALPFLYLATMEV